jgi:dGTPase
MASTPSPNLNLQQEQHLASYAATQEHSRGRMYKEHQPCTTRTEFQRDRDRIIHCTAFRRLEYKTQVFINHEGDLYRTRLTHSLEVAQIARSISRALNLNEDLTEAISLAHDLGHTPFGHAGQDALHSCMKDYGGFEHNFQSLRVVDCLEEKYPDFDGLNLMFETREGILKHCSLHNARNMGELGLRFIERHQPSLEAQLTNIADEIAYDNHDIDDGLRSGLLTAQQLCKVEIFNENYTDVQREYPNISDKRKAKEVIRRIINQLVTDLIFTTQESIGRSGISTIDDARKNSHPLIMFSSATRDKMKSLKSFLHTNLYQHEQVNKMSENAKKVITGLFERFLEKPDLLPEKHRQKALLSKDRYNEKAYARVISDYIAGMTDRYAALEHDRVINQK